MAALDYASTTQTTEQTHTGDSIWTDISGASIADADITDGGEYLLIVSAIVGGDSAAKQFGFRMVHGTTPTVFPGSTMIFEPGGATIRLGYFFLHKFTASASAGENIIECQFQCTSDTSSTVHADTIVMVAINLDGLASSDWHYGEDSDTLEHTTSFADFATTGAFTPNGTDDWLLLFCANYAIDDIVINTEYRLRLDGTTASPTDDAPFFSEEGENVACQQVYGMSRVFAALSNASHQFWVQGRDDETGANDHLYSAVIALRLNAFQDHAFQWTEAPITLAVDDTFEEIANIDPDIGPVTSDVIVIGSVAFLPGDGTQANLSGSLGGTVTPTGRDATKQIRSYDSTDENAMSTMFVISDASDVQDLDLDAQVNVVANTAIEDRSFVAFSIELAAAAAAKRRRGLIPTRHGRQ